MFLLLRISKFDCLLFLLLNARNNRKIIANFSIIETLD